MRYPPRNNQLEKPPTLNPIENIVMSSSVEDEAPLATTITIQWYLTCSTPYFSYSYVVYQHQYLGLYVN